MATHKLQKKFSYIIARVHTVIIKSRECVQLEYSAKMELDTQSLSIVNHYVLLIIDK